MRDGRELGVVLGKSVKLDGIKPLMVSLLKQMRAVPQQGPDHSDVRAQW